MPISPSLEGKNYVITARQIHGPMSVSFNTGYVGQATADENAYATGKWSELQLMQAGSPRIVRAGFTDTLIELTKAPT